MCADFVLAFCKSTQHRASNGMSEAVMGPHTAPTHLPSPRMYYYCSGTITNDALPCCAFCLNSRTSITKHKFRGIVSLTLKRLPYPFENTLNSPSGLVGRLRVDLNGFDFWKQWMLSIILAGSCFTKIDGITGSAGVYFE